MATEKELLAKLALLQYKQDKLVEGNGIGIDDSTDTITAQIFNQLYRPQDPEHGYKIGEVVDPDGTTTDIKVPNPDVVELTQAAYDQLDYSAKYNNQVAYFVTDIPDIKIWMGDAMTYQALPLAEKMKDNYLFFIVPAKEPPESKPEEQEEEPQ